MKRKRYTTKHIIMEEENLKMSLIYKKWYSKL